MTRADKAFAAAVMTFVLAVLALGAFGYGYDALVLRFPLLAGAATAALCAAALAAGQRQADPSALRAIGAHARAAAWVAAAVPAVLVGGFAVGLPLYLLVYLRVHGRGWGASVAVALASLAIVRVGLAGGLGVPLPLAPWGFR